MAIDLTKQRPYSFRLSVPEGNRYPYGAFNAYYSNEVFYASLRTDIVDNVIYYQMNSDSTNEIAKLTAHIKWFVAYNIYDNERHLYESLCFMQEILDVTNYSMNANMLPNIGSNAHVKWNIYGICNWDDGRVYKKGDIVWFTFKIGNTLILKANVDSPEGPGTEDWDILYDLTLHELYIGVLIEDFIYDILSADRTCIIEDFVEGDEIVELGDNGVELNNTTNPFQKYSCNNYRINLSGLIFNDLPESNVKIYISSVSEYTSEDYGDITNILLTDLDENGYYNFTLENDGIYIVTIVYNSEILYQGYLFVMCSMETCLFNLMDQLYCNDLDCCNNCSEEVLKDREFKRNELRKLTVFMETISAIINYTSIAYTGRVILDDELHTNIEKAVKWYDYIEDIIDRCGTCNDSINTSNGCTQC
jgi:hypothetical protein